jgi:hypothetical protein
MKDHSKRLVHSIWSRENHKQYQNREYSENPKEYESLMIKI